MEETKEQAIVEVQEDTVVDDEKHTIIEEPYGFIYITTNLVNGKRYLGQRRFYGKWENYLGSGRAFKDALKKYGKENFKRNIIYICYSLEELNQIEYNLSVFFDVVKSKNWYNIVYGGGTMSGWTPSEDTKRKISKSLSGENNPNYGKHFSEEHKSKIKRALSGENHPMYGAHLSECHKRQISDQLIQLWKDEDYRRNMQQKHLGENNPMYGKSHSEESIEKMKKSLKERYSKEENKTKGIKHRASIPVYCENLNIYFPSMRIAEEEIGVSHSSISACCKGSASCAGKHPITGEKLHWRYATKEEYQEYIYNTNLLKKENN